MILNEAIAELTKLVNDEPALGDMEFVNMDEYAGELVVIKDFEIDRDNKSVITMTE